MFSSEIKIKNSKSSEVFAVLKSLLDSGSWLESPKNDVSITNLDKLNSNYISAPQKALEQIQKFISDFDKVVVKQETVKKDDNIITNVKKNEDNVLSNKFSFDVVDLKFASSSEIQETINNVINNSSYTFNDNSSTSSQPISIQSYSSGNQLIVSGFSKNRND